MPEWRPTVWAASSQDKGLVRSQTGEFISSSDPKFDDYNAVSYKDMACIVEAYVYNCKEFKEKVPDCTKN